MSTPSSQPAQGDTTTPATFLEEFPLYRVWQTKTWNNPDTISLDCPACGKETTWSFVADLTTISSFNLVKYQCHLCRGTQVLYVLLRNQSGIVKFGQLPAQSARVPHSIENRLGHSAGFYKKALTCRNEGYGLAAVAYYR